MMSEGHAHPCISVCKQSLMSSVFLRHSPSCSSKLSRQGLLLNLQLTDWLEQTDTTKGLPVPASQHTLLHLASM